MFEIYVLLVTYFLGEVSGLLKKGLIFSIRPIDLVFLISEGEGFIKLRDVII